MDKKTVARQIKILQGSLKNQEMADILGVKLDRYQKWISGQIIPPPEFVEILADRFGVSMDFIYRAKEVEKTADDLGPEERNILRAYRESDPIGQRDILLAALGAKMDAEQKKGS